MLSVSILISACPLIFATNIEDPLIPTSLLDPNTGEYLPVTDVREAITELTEEMPEDIIFEEKFVAQHRADNKSRAADLPPVPGGVGYGAFYNAAFQKSFTKGTILAKDIITPRKAGGNVSDYLYLTSCNRASKGVEAFILYKGQEDFMFKVFDWARPEAERWQVSIPYSKMSKYIRSKDFYGTTRNFVTVQNRTEQTGTNKWTNYVWLGTKTGYDLVYSYTYTATLTQQRDKWYGSWGPIVETFQKSYSNVNPMGFGAVQLSAKNSSAWSKFSYLSASQSTIRNDKLGFKPTLLSPNHAFLVR